MQSIEQQRGSISDFIDVLDLGRTSLMAHSRSGGFAVDIALADPERCSHVVVLGSGVLLPPLDEGQLERHEDVQRRADHRMAESEPSTEDTRKLLQADTFNHFLITEERLALGHSRSIGKNFANHVARQLSGREILRQPRGPAWERLSELKVPLLTVYGREDRAHAAERAELLKSRRPELAVHVISNCKHMVHWDAADEVLQLSVPFLNR